ncbi:MAG: hypothetical protein ACK5ZU_10375 [Acidobacteriota bacterium]
MVVLEDAFDAVGMGDEVIVERPDTVDADVAIGAVEEGEKADGVALDFAEAAAKEVVGVTGRPHG